MRRNRDQRPSGRPMPARATSPAPSGSPGANPADFTPMSTRFAEGIHFDLEEVELMTERIETAGRLQHTARAHRPGIRLLLNTRHFHTAAEELTNLAFARARQFVGGGERSGSRRTRSGASALLTGSASPTIVAPMTNCIDIPSVLLQRGRQVQCEDHVADERHSPHDTW